MRIKPNWSQQTRDKFCIVVLFNTNVIENTCITHNTPKNQQLSLLFAIEFVQTRLETDHCSEGAKTEKLRRKPVLFFSLKLPSSTRESFAKTNILSNSLAFPHPNSRKLSDGNVNQFEDNKHEVKVNTVIYWKHLYQVDTPKAVIEFF